MQRSFSIDLGRCTGCSACELACQIENDLPFDSSWRTVSTFNEERLPGLPTVHLSLACNHCETPACLIHCPALAYTKDTRTGAVTVEPDKCIGCRYCSWVCPYDAPRFDESSGTMRKCTFCNDRLHEGLEPACVDACPTGALGTGSGDEPVQREGRPGSQPGPGSDRWDPTPPGFPSSSLGPAIEFCGSPELDWNGDAVLPRDRRVDPGSRPRRGSVSKISLRGEWTLLVFTLIVPFLVGCFGSRALGDGGFSFSGWVHVALGGLGMGLSTLHLGRPLRAYRAVLNLRRSWLSREVVGFSAFFGLSSAAALLGGLFSSGPFVVLTCALGAVTLFSMDKVYEVAATVSPTRWHSASSLSTGILVFGLAADLPLVWGLCLAIKASLYGIRSVTPMVKSRARVGFFRVGVRIGAGFVLPLGWSLFIDPSSVSLGVVVGCLVGEVLDRIEFYEELTIVTPQTEIRKALVAG